MYFRKKYLFLKITFEKICLTNRGKKICIITDLIRHRHIIVSSKQLGTSWITVGHKAKKKRVDALIDQGISQEIQVSLSFSKEGSSLTVNT